MYMIVFVAIVVCCFHDVAAQSTAVPSLTPQQRVEARQQALLNMSQRSAQERIAWNLRVNSRVPKAKFRNIQAGETPSQTLANPGSQALTSNTIPTPFRVPGEFEECQGALLSWPYYAYDSKGRQIDPLTKDYGYHYLNQSGSKYEIEAIAGYEIDTSITTEGALAPTWAELADAIQKELPLWMVLYNDADSSVLKEFMVRMGRPLTNVRFFNVGGGNAFWIRDFGPVACYYGPQDSIGFIDPAYYVGRAADDSIPNVLASILGYPNFGTQLKYEGGNFMCDGQGIAFGSSMVDSINGEPYGQAYVKYDSSSKTFKDIYPSRQSWTAKKTLDTLKGIFNCPKFTVLQTFVNDGGTGHIDMYTKIFDPETIISTVYPEEFNNSDFDDYRIGKKTVAQERATTTYFGKPFHLFTLPVPTSDSGQYDSTTADTYGADSRGFLNGLTINKTFIFPSFSSKGSGNEAQLAQVMELYKQYLPGYKLVPMDSRILTPMAGAIHCITMQIPAENPLTILSESWKGNVENLASYPVKAKISNRSGIRSAVLHWRRKGASAWNDISLQLTDSLYKASIPGNSSASFETTEYYIEAESNNGKKAVLPITAPEGFYSFSYGTTVDVREDQLSVRNLSIFPNPVQENATVLVDLNQAASVKAVVSSVEGRVLQTIDLGMCTMGPTMHRVNLANIPAGVYIMQLLSNGVQFHAAKLVKN